MPSAQLDQVYPPSAFYFKVMFGGANETTDTSFQEVSGISSEVDVESIVY